MIGEGPGRSEDFLGDPFVGEAGHCLKGMVDLCLRQQCQLVEIGEHDTEFNPYLPPEKYVDKVILSSDPLAAAMVTRVQKDYPDMRIGYSNLVACLPLADPEVEGGSRMLRAPTKSEATACRERLLELIEIVRPRAIVALGNVPKELVPKPKHGLPEFVQFVEHCIHPSAMLRLQSDNPIRYIESRNRTILTLTRLKKRLWGLE